MRFSLVGIALIVLAISACAQERDLALALPADDPIANAKFDQYLKSKFPVGSPEVHLLRELKREGFKISMNSRLTRAQNERIFFLSDGVRPCGKIWMIRWAPNDGKIAAISGVVGSECI